ncbi:ZrgA family zinc uptake protein [Gemmatimonas sp.]|uniref:ZrgA family zinc uptake protein n=1 Tax=Gemmatimonas sp. TaxID=1962908 RepID=UPI003F70FF03
MLASVPSTALAQHVHGHATLVIGMEVRTGQIEFGGSGEDLYGFERSPRTAAERTRQTAALDRLRTRGASLIRFGVSAVFPGVDRVAVQLVSDTTQVGATISRDRGTVTP